MTPTQIKKEIRQCAKEIKAMGKKLTPKERKQPWNKPFSYSQLYIVVRYICIQLYLASLPQKPLKEARGNG